MFISSTVYLAPRSTCHQFPCKVLSGLEPSFQSAHHLVLVFPSLAPLAYSFETLFSVLALALLSRKMLVYSVSVVCTRSSAQDIKAFAVPLSLTVVTPYSRMYLAETGLSNATIFHSASLAQVCTWAVASCQSPSSPVVLTCTLQLVTRPFSTPSSSSVPCRGR